MITLKHKQSLKALLAAGLLTGALTACMTPDELAALNASLDNGPDATPSSVPAPAVGPSCFDERFVQPAAQISRSIDLLFVMDTSGSMSDNRAKVAAGISAFVGELPSNVDYQVGVMLAHGSKSSWSGKMFSYGGATIFNSKTMSVSTIETQLQSMVLHTPTDTGIEQGEEGSYSLMKGLTTNLAANQAAGFFRPTAALAVIFVSDENDICAPYENEPTMPGLTSAEAVLRNRDCKGGIATNTVVSAVKTLQGTRPYLFGAVVHEQIGYHDTEGNDGYGYGYMDIIQATNGVSTEINDADYTTGLATLGTLATIKLNLILDYTLAHTSVDDTTLKAYVDGKGVSMVYDPIANDVHLSSGGSALSTVDIEYCLLDMTTTSGGGTGSGSGSGTGGGTTPIPGASPTPGSSPSPSPSASPTPFPTPVIIPPPAS